MPTTTFSANLVFAICYYVGCRVCAISRSSTLVSTTTNSLPRQRLPTHSSTRAVALVYTSGHSDHVRPHSRLSKSQPRARGSVRLVLHNQQSLALPLDRPTPRRRPLPHAQDFRSKSTKFKRAPRPHERRHPSQTRQGTHAHFGERPRRI